MRMLLKNYLATSYQQKLINNVSSAPYVSLLLDSSTDKGNIDNEQLLVLWCDTDSSDEKIHTRMSFLCLHKPQQGTAVGVFKSLKHGLHCFGFQSFNKDSCFKLVGIATDGAAVNVAAGGLKGLVEEELEWIFWLSTQT